MSSSEPAADNVAVTVHLPEKTTKKALMRLRKMEKETLFQKLESTLKRANALTVKLVRARKELQDLETTKYHWEHPDEDLFPSDSKKRRSATARKNKAASAPAVDDEPKPLKKKPKKAAVEIKDEDLETA